jgi:hypothetical protein
VCREVALHQVRGEVGVRVPAGEALAPAGADPGQAGLAHEPLDPLSKEAISRKELVCLLAFTEDFLGGLWRLPQCPHEVEGFVMVQ